MKNQNRRNRIKRRKERKKRAQRRVSNIILVIAVIVFAVSAFQLYGIFSEYNKGKGEYAQIRKNVTVNVEKGKEEVFRVDFAPLLEINPDVVGWIRFDEPEEINYPVVQGKDNETYLKKTFEANTNKLGTLFVDCDNAGNFTDKNTFIYGHNMKNGSMFAQLLRYKEFEFYQKYPYFYIYTPDGNVSTYQIFSAGVVKDTSDSYIKNYADDAAYQTYLDHIKEASAYDTGVEVTTDSQIVSLSTCTNVKQDERFLVHGVKISEEPVK